MMTYICADLRGGIYCNSRVQPLWAQDDEYVEYLPPVRGAQETCSEAQIPTRLHDTRTGPHSATCTHPTRPVYRVRAPLAWRCRENAAWAVQLWWTRTGTVGAKVGFALGRLRKHRL